MLAPTTRIVRLVLPLVLFGAWAPVAHAWSWPVKGPVLTPFVYDEGHPYASGQHRGIDIGADAAGETVVAPAAGVVEFAGAVPASGESVTIDTADGYSVTLTHLGSILVSKGAPIAEGDSVGTIGPSGTPEVSGPYVHLGIRVASDPNGYVDPLDLLPPVAETAPAESTAASSPPSAGGASSGSTASEPAPAVVVNAPESTVRGSRARISRGGRGSDARTSRPAAEQPRSTQRPEASGRIPSSVRPRQAVTPRRRIHEPTSSSRRPVVEAEARPEPTGLDAGHEVRTTVRVAARPQRPELEASGSLLPLLCNGAAALVALAAAFAAALRRRRDLREQVVGAQVLHLPHAAFERRERRAA